MNAHQISEISLSPDVVDCIVFWTKNPAPMVSRLNELSQYAYYFQFTLNAYEKDVEKCLPLLDERIEVFKQLSKKIGKEKVIWRYDPVFITPKYNEDFHFSNFKKLASALSGYTEKCVFSYLDYYTNISKSLREIGVQAISTDKKNAIADKFSNTAKETGLLLETCAEDIDLSKHEIEHARCIDDRLISRILGCELKSEKDKNQRLECGCRASIDIGLYNTCRNGCVYCYANHSFKTVMSNSEKYDNNSPILCGTISDDDKINIRSVKSDILKDNQIRFEGFDK